MKMQLHVSGLNLLSRCGVAFEFRYLRGIKTRSNVALAIGRAVDQAVGLDLTAKQMTGELLPAEQIKDSARDAMAKEWEQGIDLEADWIESGPEKAKAQATDTSISLASLHHEKAAPKILPTHIQRSWVLDITGLPLELAGTIDVQEANAVRDTKTSGKSPSADTADKSLQLTTYALAVKAHDGRVPEKVILDYLVHTKTPKLVQLESARSEKSFAHLLERVNQASRIMESGIFSPAPVDSWWCSKQFCNFWDMCPYAARPVSRPVPDLISQLERSLANEAPTTA